MREYFYGKKGVNSYFPFSFEIPFSSVSIYKIGGMDRNRYTIVHKNIYFEPMGKQS